MSQSNIAVLPGNEVDPDVERLWAAVFRCSAIVITHSKKFGFTGMTKPDPNIHDLLMYVKLVEGAIDVLVESPAAVSMEEMRLLLNAQKQFTSLKMVAKIIESNGTHDQFEDAIRELENQAPF
jgi:hypothetical protein